MNIQIIGKFFDNHSLSIINRNLAITLNDLGHSVRIICLDSFNYKYKINITEIDTLFKLSSISEFDENVIEIRHSYPPILNKPKSNVKKLVFIQPWEYSKVPSEWAYKFSSIADLLIVPSNFCKDVYTRCGIDNIHVVRNFVDDLFNNENTSKTINKFIFVGNAQYRKGLDILLSAWSKVTSRGQKVELIIKDNVEVYGANNILNDIIHLQYTTNCGKITYIDDIYSTQEMATLYKSAKFIIHPYRAEGYGMHIYEAAACGCLPIISNHPPTNEHLNNDNSILINSSSKIIDLTDSKYFAIKPGDSLSPMQTHATINEPDVNNLANIINSINQLDNIDEIIQNKLGKIHIPRAEEIAQEYISLIEK